ncbi:hypothetical protein [Morganella morganii IS15]|nr:hypothetical protein CSB69_1178 [Morganella morganii]EMP51657.1 hypothetical protein C790_00844 [Morganella morganii SC01]CDK66835.1 hypothetical protein [Morganella morganii IS15]
MTINNDNGSLSRRTDEERALVLSCRNQVILSTSICTDILVPGGAHPTI